MHRNDAAAPERSPANPHPLSPNQKKKFLAFAPSPGVEPRPFPAGDHYLPMHAAQDAESVHTPTFKDEKLYLVARIADDSAPNLADRAEDRDMACQMAWRIVRSYAPTTEAE